MAMLQPMVVTFRAAETGRGDRPAVPRFRRRSATRGARRRAAAGMSAGDGRGGVEDDGAAQAMHQSGLMLDASGEKLLRLGLGELTNQLGVTVHILGLVVVLAQGTLAPGGPGPRHEHRLMTLFDEVLQGSAGLGQLLILYARIITNMTVIMLHVVLLGNEGLLGIVVGIIGEIVIIAIVRGANVGLARGQVEVDLHRLEAFKGTLYIGMRMGTGGATLGQRLRGDAKSCNRVRVRLVGGFGHFLPRQMSPSPPVSLETLLDPLNAVVNLLRRQLCLARLLQLLDFLLLRLLQLSFLPFNPLVLSLKLQRQGLWRRPSRRLKVGLELLGELFSALELLGLSSFRAEFVKFFCGGLHLLCEDNPR